MTHDGPKNHVSRYVDTPYAVLIYGMFPRSTLFIRSDQHTSDAGMR